jgi:hypothetical protein
LDDGFAICRADEGGEAVEEVGERLQEEEGDEVFSLQQLVDYLHDALHASQLHEVRDDLRLVDALRLSLRVVLQALL